MSSGPDHYLNSILRGSTKRTPATTFDTIDVIRVSGSREQYAVHFEARVDRPSFLSFNRFRECRVEIAYGLAIELRARRDSHR